METQREVKGERNWVKEMKRGRKRGRKVLVFFSLTGFLGNDWVVMVLRLNLPNGTEAQPAPWCLFLSIFYLFHFRHTNHTYIQNLHLICMAAHCFLPFFLICYPIFFLAHSAESSGQSRDLWLANQRRGYFLRNPLCQQVSSLRPHMLTWALNHCWKRLWFMLSLLRSDLELNISL